MKGPRKTEKLTSKVIYHLSDKQWFPLETEFKGPPYSQTWGLIDKGTSDSVSKKVIGKANIIVSTHKSVSLPPATVLKVLALSHSLELPRNNNTSEFFLLSASISVINPTIVEEQISWTTSTWVVWNSNNSRFFSVSQPLTVPLWLLPPQHFFLFLETSLLNLLSNFIEIYSATRTVQ